MTCRYMHKHNTDTWISEQNIIYTQAFTSPSNTIFPISRFTDRQLQHISFPLNYYNCSRNTTAQPIGNILISAHFKSTKDITWVKIPSTEVHSTIYRSLQSLFVLTGDHPRDVIRCWNVDICLPGASAHWWRHPGPRFDGWCCLPAKRAPDS